MISLLLHAIAGAFTVVLFFVFNKHLYGAGLRGSAMTFTEIASYILALAGLGFGWYFNTQYMIAYGDEAGWIHFTKMLFTNPAAGSGSQDLIITNAILFPLWTIVDGPRRGMKHCWLYFVMSLFTSFAFAMGLYLAAQERQVRWNGLRAGGV
jgi:hypothetical protein